MTALRRSLLLLLLVLGLRLGLVCQVSRAQDATPAPMPAIPAADAPPAVLAEPPHSPPLAPPLAPELFQPPAEQPLAPPRPNQDEQTLFPTSGPELQPRSHVSSHLSGNKAKRGARVGDLTAQQADSDPLAIRVAFRRAKTVAMLRDPGLADLLHQAGAAGTDLGKRQWLKQYYVRLYAEVQKIDRSPSMATHIALLSQIAEQRYDPRRRAVAGEEDLVNGRGGRGRKAR